MDTYIAKIYELLYSPIVTPYNLIENVKLDNYNYVNYYKGESGIIAEMECIMDEGLNTIFYYHFDENDRLVKIYKKREGEPTLVFDRNEEIKGVEKTYLAKAKSFLNCEVV